jgi:hypothetical protein
MLAAAIGFILGGIASAIGGVLGFVAVVTAACAGASRYAAVLLSRDQAQIERATAKGFFVGVLASVVFLLLDRL